MTLAYHFVSDTLRDGRPIPADGEWLEHDGEVVICQSGLHASEHPLDALQYAPGNTLCLVELDGIVTRQDDKLVAKRRKIISRIDAESLMRELSRWSALQVIELWDAPVVVRQYLTTGDDSFRAAARAATWDAARAAAWAATWDAAWAAARAAAWAAARDATWDATWAAARAAAWAATWDAARAAQRARFKAMVDAAFAELSKEPKP